jgi:hypothetical protein
MIQRVVSRAHGGDRLAGRLLFTRHGAALFCGTHATSTVASTERSSSP